MSVFSQLIIKELISDPSSDCISVYMPITENVREDQLRLKNLLAKLTKDTESPPARIIIKEMSKLLNDSAFWAQPAKGLALFYSAKNSQHIKTSVSFREIALHSTAFFITPLLPLINNNIDFSVLVLSQKQVRVLEGDMHDFTEKTIPGMPQNIDSALWYRDSERAGQRQNSNSGSAHGQAESFRQPNVEITEYAHIVKKALHNYLTNLQVPLILAGAEPLQGVFRKICRHQHIVEGGLLGNQDSISSESVYRAAREIARPIARKRTSEALKKLTDTQGSQPNRIILDPAKIIQQARAGRIHTLLYRNALQPNSREIFGEYVRSNASSTSIYEDLVDQAARHTLLSGGQVISVAPHQLPSIAAAVLRY